MNFQQRILRNKPMFFQDFRSGVTNNMRTKGKKINNKHPLMSYICMQSSLDKENRCICFIRRQKSREKLCVFVIKQLPHKDFFVSLFLLLCVLYACLICCMCLYCMFVQGSTENQFDFLINYNYNRILDHYSPHSFDGYHPLVQHTSKFSIEIINETKFPHHMLHKFTNLM